MHTLLPKSRIPSICLTSLGKYRIFPAFPSFAETLLCISQYVEATSMSNDWISFYIHNSLLAGPVLYPALYYIQSTLYIQTIKPTDLNSLLWIVYILLHIFHYLSVHFVLNQWIGIEPFYLYSRLIHILLFFSLRNRNFTSDQLYASIRLVWYAACGFENVIHNLTRSFRIVFILLRCHRP